MVARSPDHLIPLPQCFFAMEIKQRNNNFPKTYKMIHDFKIKNIGGHHFKENEWVKIHFISSQRPSSLPKSKQTKMNYGKLWLII